MTKNSKKRPSINENESKSKIARRNVDDEMLTASENENENVEDGKSEAQKEKLLRKKVYTLANSTKKSRVKKGIDETLEAEAILTHRVAKYKRSYFIKWKGHTIRTWLSHQKVRSTYPEMLHEYLEGLKNGSKVEKIVKHKYDKHNAKKYLLKWKDHSKGETWETRKATSLVCPNMQKEYDERLEKAQLKANEVEAITSHGFFACKLKYLIKWKNRSKGETWETRRTAMFICRDIVDDYNQKNPDCLKPKNFKT